jgi:hypothetical protein
VGVESQVVASHRTTDGKLIQVRSGTSPPRQQFSLQIFIIFCKYYFNQNILIY